MAVSAEQLITGRIPGTGRLREGLAAAGAVLYGGTLAFVAVDGYIVPTMTGPLDLAGVMRGTVDNTGGAAGDKQCELYTHLDIELPLAGVTQADVGSLAYATDNYTLTLTALANTLVGQIMRVAGTNLAEVRVDIEKRA